MTWATDAWEQMKERAEMARGEQTMMTTIVTQTGGNEFAVPSSDGTHVYTVRETINDETFGDGIMHTWECNCEAGRHGKMCKHVRAVVAFLED